VKERGIRASKEKGAKKGGSARQKRLAWELPQSKARDHRGGQIRGEKAHAEENHLKKYHRKMGQRRVSGRVRRDMSKERERDSVPRQVKRTVMADPMRRNKKG